MTNQSPARKLAVIPSERDRLALVVARLSDIHRKQHRRLQHPKCVTCGLLRPVRDEPSVIDAHDRHQEALTADIDQYVAAIPPKETTHV